MGSCVVKVDTTTPLGNGYRLAAGTAKLSSSVAAGGDQLNLANAGFLESGLCYVSVGSASGYVLESNATNATFGGVGARFMILNTTTVNGAESNVALYEAVSQDLSAVNFKWSAIGQAT